MDILFLPFGTKDIIAIAIIILFFVVGLFLTVKNRDYESSKLNEKEKQTAQRNFYFGLGSFFISMVVSILYLYFVKRNKNEEIKKLKDKKK